jgi:cobyrinic acid a,c-diamide synthase
MKAGARQSQKPEHSLPPISLGDRCVGEFFETKNSAAQRARFFAKKKMSEKTTSSGGIIVAGMQSSSGKTAVTCALLAALRARGLTVQPFKVGPDFIDPAYHAHFSSVPSRNLDAWLMGRDAIMREVRIYASEKLGVVEGVMGLFDGGCAASDEGSAMELARWLDWPVLLVVPAAKTGRSLAAALRGFLAEAGENRICGVVLNGVSGSSHTEFLREAIAPLRVPVLGSMPVCEELRWPERHLGLQAISEAQLPADADLARLGERWLNVEKIVHHATCEQHHFQACHSARSEKSLAISDHAAPQQAGNDKRFFASAPKDGLEKKHTRIAIARDEAFHFYYESNLDFLRARGAQFVPFSPLRDSGLPNEIDAVILGGGFPEMFAAQLADNLSMRSSIRSAVCAGLPFYAECGGLMLLAEKLITRDGARFPMAGAIPGAVEMTQRLCHFGYCSAEKGGRSFRGHEFHHSRWLGEESHANLWSVTKRRTGRRRREGFTEKNLHASYVHLFWPNAATLFDELFQNNGENTRLASLGASREHQTNEALALQTP